MTKYATPVKKAPGCKRRLDFFSNTALVNHDHDDTTLADTAYTKLQDLKHKDIVLQTDDVFSQRQEDHDDRAKTAYLALAAKQGYRSGCPGALTCGPGQAWSDMIGLDNKKPINGSNPSVVRAYFGHNLQRVLMSCHFDLRAGRYPSEFNTLVVFKVPLTLFGNNLRLHYDPRTTSSHHRLDLYVRAMQHGENVPAFHTVRLDDDTKRLIDQHVQSMQGTVRAWETFVATTPNNDEDFLAFLWHSRHFLQETVQAGMHHCIEDMCETLLPVDVYTSYLTQNVPHVTVTSEDFQRVHQTYGPSALL